MYLFRGLNELDYNLYCSNKDILCNLSRYNNDPNMHRVIHEITKKDLSLSLDRIIGHVSGKNIKYSAWISASSDYNYVLKEYCIPQCGRYNLDSHRKNVIVIDSNNKIDENIDRNSTNVSDYISYYIDLSNNNLQKYVNTGFILPLSKNEKSYYYVENKTIYLDDHIPNIQGFSNFATGASEYLFFISIKKENIKYIIDPLMQDIIYAYTYGLNDKLFIEKIIDLCMDYECLIKNRINNNFYNFTDKEISLINYLYTERDNKYNNVIDLVIENYDSSHDIVIDYEKIKNLKRIILSKITGLDNINIVDDSIYVINNTLNNNGILNNNHIINKRNIHDILYVTDENGNLHKGNSKVKTISNK